MFKGKSLRRALETKDAVRINSNIPLITDTTELISPADAEQMLNRNKKNRPINWRKVEEFSETMKRGEWKLHPQGIILDPDGNLITGQTRLWAIVYSGVSVYMRVSRGSPTETAFVIDRGRPQTSRDLSSRRTGRRHSPIEASIARAVCVLRGFPKPSTDQVAGVITEKSLVLSKAMKLCSGGKKTKAILMILACMVESTGGQLNESLVNTVPILAERLEVSLAPYSASGCWGRGASFGMAMQKAKKIVDESIT